MMSSRPDRIINIHGHLRHDQDIAARVKLWEEWHVEKFICLCLHPRWLSHGYFTNEDFLAIKGKYGEVMIGFAAANIVAVGGIDGPNDVERYVEQGFAGLKFLDPSYPLDHDAYFPIYERAQSLRVPIFFHTGYLAPDYETDGKYGVNSNNMRPYRFDRIARAFPKLTIIGAHLGIPHCHEALQMIASHPNVFADFSGGSGKKPHVRTVLSAMLPHPMLKTDMSDPQENRALEWFKKLCFGTDNPEPSVWVPASEYIMDELRIPEHLRRAFYYDNAAALLGLRR